MPQLATLCRIKPLSNRSFKCSINYFNSVGAILDEIIYIGSVSIMISMLNTIYLSGDTLGR